MRRPAEVLLATAQAAGGSQGKTMTMLPVVVSCHFVASSAIAVFPLYHCLAFYYK